MTDHTPPGEPYPPPPPPAAGSSGGQVPQSGAYEPAPAPWASGASYPPPPPPPGGGSYPPPPPPSSGGYAPPPPGPAIRALPTESYTPWFTRVLALLIDYLPFLVLQGIGRGIMLATQQTSCVTDINQYDVTEYCASPPSMIGQLAQWLLSLVGLAYWVWNYGYRQGSTGSSIGKSVLKFKVVSEATGQPLGFGMSVVRQIAHFVDALICFVGYLFPLWDAKRQTVADKIMTTVCLPI
jgi:uncharacterized RDD family membrane protein YckC